MRVKRSPRFPKSFKKKLQVLRLPNITNDLMEGEERETRKRLFMDLYSMLLCFPFTIKQYKMKESEHKKSTHKIILNFNRKKKQREERNIAQLSAGDDFMTFMHRERVSGLRFESSTIAPACSSHTWLRCLLHIDEIFMFINFMYRTAELRKVACSLLVADVFPFHSFPIGTLTCCLRKPRRFAGRWKRRVNNNNGDAVNLISTNEWLIYFACNLYVNLSGVLWRKKIYSLFFFLHSSFINFSSTFHNRRNKFQLNVVQGSQIEFQPCWDREARRETRDEAAATATI